MSHVAVRRRVVIALGLLVVWVLPARADGQAVDRYRGFQLGTSVRMVAEVAGLTPGAAQTLHTRPALLQELNWWPPHVRRGTAADAEPVEHMSFGFYNDQLYRITVTFSPEPGIPTSVADLTRLLSAQYGAPSASPREPVGDHPNGVLVAGWDADDVSVRLSRTSQALRLVLTARGIGQLAGAVAGESLRLLEEEDRMRRLPDSPGAATPEARLQ